MSRSGITPAGKMGILCILFGIPLLFVGMSWGLGKLSDMFPYAATIIVVLGCDIYANHVGSLLYDFYEGRKPIWAWIPCIGEAAMLPSTYSRIVIPMYPVAIVFGALALAPYSIIKVFGEWAIQALPFWSTIIVLIIMLAVQIIKGIGLCALFTDVEECWLESVHTRVGAIAKFRPLLFFPFIRAIGLYGLAKPLETLVTFNSQTVSDQEDSVLDE